MAPVRRTLRVSATLWLVLQAAWLAALMPRDCCTAHRRPEPGCHQSAAATRCPMRGPDGRPCPMHQPAHATHAHGKGAAAGHHDRQPPASADCRLSGACDGPMDALVVLLSTDGILPGRTAPPLLPDGRHIVDPVGDTLIARLDPPDPPPPRA